MRESALGRSGRVRFGWRRSQGRSREEFHAPPARGKRGCHTTSETGVVDGARPDCPPRGGRRQYGPNSGTSISHKTGRGGRTIPPHGGRSCGPTEAHGPRSGSRDRQSAIHSKRPGVRAPIRQRLELPGRLPARNGAQRTPDSVRARGPACGFRLRGRQVARVDRLTDEVA